MQVLALIGYASGTCLHRKGGRPSQEAAGALGCGGGNWQGSLPAALP